MIPVTKTARMNAEASLESKLTGLEAVPATLDLPSSQSLPVVGEKDLRITPSSHAPNHPKGHKTHSMDELVQAMMKQPFMRCTDTLNLYNVWFQPLRITECGRTALTLEIRTVVWGQNIHEFIQTTKFDCDDMIRILYLGSMIDNDLSEIMREPSSVWLASKIEEWKKNVPNADEENKAELCQWILANSYTSYPLTCHRAAIFFRKTCCHTYHEGSMPCRKFPNPNIYKAKAKKGSFEYVIEGRIFILPAAWWRKVENVEGEDSGKKAATMQ